MLLYGRNGVFIGIDLSEYISTIYYEITNKLEINKAYVLFDSKKKNDKIRYFNILLGYHASGSMAQLIFNWFDFRFAVKWENKSFKKIQFKSFFIQKYG